MWLDPILKNTCMLDPIGGSVSLYDRYVRLVPAREPAQEASPART